jgi:RNase P subunit RPR2
MAEFCKECYEKIFGKATVIESEDDDLCEGCGEIKKVVVRALD